MTQLRIVDKPPVAWDAQPGDMWPCHAEGHVVAGRTSCWVIRLPGSAHTWHTNGVTTNGGQFWNVTGEAPNITVTPSINVGPEIWHGSITDGVLSPDEAAR